MYVHLQPFILGKKEKVDMNRKCFETFTILETERLILRNIEYKDVKAILKIYGDPKAAEYDWLCINEK